MPRSVHTRLSVGGMPFFFAVNDNSEETLVDTVLSLSGLAHPCRVAALLELAAQVWELSLQGPLADSNRATQCLEAGWVLIARDSRLQRTFDLCSIDVASASAKALSREHVTVWDVPRNGRGSQDCPSSRGWWLLLSARYGGLQNVNEDQQVPRKSHAMANMAADSKTTGTSIATTVPPLIRYLAPRINVSAIAATSRPSCTSAAMPNECAPEHASPGSTRAATKPQNTEPSATRIQATSGSSAISSTRAR